MRQRKADRWERLVEKVRWGQARDGYMFCPDQVARLLRREHRAVVRMVTRFLNTELKGQSQDCPRCYVQACNDILDRLNARAR